MLGSSRLFGGRAKASTKVVASDDIYPVHLLDGMSATAEHTPIILFRFNDVLNADKLHQSLARVLEHGDWRKLGGRVRKDAEGKLQLHVPQPFTPERPAVYYSHETFDLGIEEHPLASQLPKTTAVPTLQPSCGQFREFCCRPNAPGHLADYLESDDPGVALHVTSFQDATLVAVSWCHFLMDGLALSHLITAWCQSLAGREDEIAPVVGAREDAALQIWEDETASKEPYLWGSMMLTGFGFFWFALRFVWELIFWSKVGARTLFLPASFVAGLRQQAEKEAPEGEFVSDGDIICAWFARLATSVRKHAGPVTFLNVVDIRTRVPSVFEKGGVYLQNLTLASFTFLKPSVAQSDPLGALAFRIRQSIALQVTEEQIRAIYRHVMPYIKNTGNAPMFGEPNAMLVIVSNWTKAKFLHSVDFSPAVISAGTQGPERENPSGQPVYLMAAQVKQAAVIRNTAVISAKDHSGNYWVNLYMPEGVFAAIDKYVREL